MSVYVPTLLAEEDVIMTFKKVPRTIIESFMIPAQMQLAGRILCINNIHEAIFYVNTAY